MFFALVFLILLVATQTNVGLKMWRILKLTLMSLKNLWINWEFLLLLAFKVLKECSSDGKTPNFGEREGRCLTLTKIRLFKAWTSSPMIHLCENSCTRKIKVIGWLRARVHSMTNI